MNPSQGWVPQLLGKPSPELHGALQGENNIIDATPEPWNICFALMAYLGLRTAEAVGIAWNHIDLSAGVLRVCQSNWRGKLQTVKSKSSNRDLPLPAVLVEMLRDYQCRWRPNVHGLIFANAKGQPITSCYVRRDVLHAVRERLGIARGAFHAFRHGLGTALMQNGRVLAWCNSSWATPI